MDKNELYYDVFISYRRDGGSHYARMLDLAFRLMGVKPFFDREEIKRGYFDKTILTHIERAKYFLFVLTPNSLDRCTVDADDWVKRELVTALETKDDKKIVVVTPEDEVVWPDEMPQELDSLRRIQCHCIDFESDAFVDDLRRVIRDCFIGVRTDSDRRAQEMEKRNGENDFVKQALLLWANDGKLDAQERKRLDAIAKEHGIDDKTKDKLLKEVEVKYQIEQNAVQRRLGSRVKRFIVQVLWIVGLVAVISCIAWYNGYVHGRRSAVRGGTNEDCIGEQISESKYDEGKGNGMTCGLATESGEKQLASTPPGRVHGGASAPTSATDNKSAESIFAKRTKEDARRELQRFEWNGIQTTIIECDFRSILGKQYKDTMFIMSWTSQDADRVKGDSATKEILRQIDCVRTEPMSLVQMGMQINEIISARPDLVLKLGDIRHAANESVRRLIREGKHMEALSYYESVETAFKYCGMRQFDRPNFSGE